MVGSRDPLSIRLMETQDIPVIVRAFQSIGWRGKTRELYDAYLSEQNKGQRTVLTALAGGEFAGYVTIQWQSDYPPFVDSGTPEVKDLNVLPDFRRRGIATRLVDETEKLVFQKADSVGIGFGISADYGPAQRMYVLRGYVPDGRGSFSDGRFVPDDASVRVFDCIIHLTKKRTR